MAGRTKAPAEDPLADLREPDEPVTGLGDFVMKSPTEPEPVVAEIRPMVTVATQDQMVSEAVAAWHQDPTTQGFLHGGGQCGCRYVARVAIQAAVPLMTEEDLEEKELGASD